MNLQEILRVKGTKVHSITPDATLDDVVERLVQFNCGSLVVCESGDSPMLLGIITERDILRAYEATRSALGEMRVSEVMTVEVVTAGPNDSVQQIMGLMTTNRIRHLPIVENGRLVGIISIGDVVKAQHDRLSMENHYLKSYIQGDVDDTVVAYETARFPR